MSTIHNLLTRKLYPVITTLSISHTTVKGHKYKRAYAKIPIEIAEQIAREKKSTHVVVLIGKASHLHAQYWETQDDILWKRLDPKIREELEILGNTEWSPSMVTLIPATREQLEELGLDPSQPVTFQDIVEAIQRKLLVELQAEKTSKPLPASPRP